MQSLALKEKKIPESAGEFKFCAVRAKRGICFLNRGG